MAKASRRRRDGNTLSEDELEFLRSDRSAPLIRAYVERNAESVSVRTSAYRKVAASARAEREALTEVAMLAVTRARADSVVAAGDRVAELDRPAVR